MKWDMHDVVGPWHGDAKLRELRQARSQAKKMRFGQRVLRPIAQGQAPDSRKDVERRSLHQAEKILRSIWSEVNSARSHLQIHFAEEVDSAARKPLAADKAAGFQGRFVVAELVDDTVAELWRQTRHTVGEGDDGGEKQAWASDLGITDADIAINHAEMP